MKYVYSLLKIILFCYVVYFFSHVDFFKISALFGLHQLCSILILFVFHTTRILRFKSIVKVVGANISVLESLRGYYIGLAFAIVTPGRFGEFYRLKYMDEIGIPAKQNAQIFVAEKFTDLSSLTLFLISAVLTVFLKINPVIIFLLMAVLVWIFIVVIWQLGLSINWGWRFEKGKTGSKVTALRWFSFITSILQLNKYAVANLYVKTFLCWFIFIGALWVGLTPIHELTWLETVFVYLLNSIAVALPISFNGYGLRETLIGALLFDNVSENYIIASVTIQFTLFYLTSVIVGMVIYLLKGKALCHQRS